MTSKNRTETGVIHNGTFEKIMKTFDKKKKTAVPAVKLYVWHGVLEAYTDGIMFALATSKKEAEELILASTQCEGVKETLREELQRVEPVVYKKPVGFFLMGGG